MSVVRPARPDRQAERQARGAAARLSGRRAEVVAALWLMAKGYRILGFRLATPLGRSTCWRNGAACWPLWKSRAGPVWRRRWKR